MPRKKARAKKVAGNAAPSSVLKEIEVLERELENATGNLGKGLERAVRQTAKSLEVSRKRKAALSARKQKAMDKIRAVNERLRTKKTAAAQASLVKAREAKAALLAQETEENAKLAELRADLATLKEKAKAFDTSQKAAIKALRHVPMPKKKKRRARKAAAPVVAEPIPIVEPSPTVQTPEEEPQTTKSATSTAGTRSDAVSE